MIFIKYPVDPTKPIQADSKTISFLFNEMELDDDLKMLAVAVGTWDSPFAGRHFIMTAADMEDDAEFQLSELAHLLMEEGCTKQISVPYEYVKVGAVYVCVNGDFVSVNEPQTSPAFWVYDELEDDPTCVFGAFAGALCHEVNRQDSNTPTNGQFDFSYLGQNLEHLLPSLLTGESWGDRIQDHLIIY